MTNRRWPGRSEEDTGRRLTLINSRSQWVSHGKATRRRGQKRGMKIQRHPFGVGGASMQRAACSGIRSRWDGGTARVLACVCVCAAVSWSFCRHASDYLVGEILLESSDGRDSGAASETLATSNRTRAEPHDPFVAGVIELAPPHIASACSLRWRCVALIDFDQCLY